MVDIIDSVDDRMSSGKLKSVDGLVIHHTGGHGTVSGTVEGLAGRGLGITFVMDRDGSIHRVAPEGSRSEHVKNSNSRIKNVNSRFEGIEVIANDDSDITDAQRAAFVEFANWHAQTNDYDLQEGLKSHGEISPHKRQTEGATLKWSTFDANNLPIPEDAMVGDINNGFPAMPYTQFAGITAEDNPLVAAVAAVAENRVAPIPSVQTQGLAAQRALAPSIDAPPIPRPRSERPVVQAPIPLTMSERMKELRGGKPSVVATVAKQEIVPLPRPRPTTGPTEKKVGGTLQNITAMTGGINSFYDFVTSAQRSFSSTGTTSTSSPNTPTGGANRGRPTSSKPTPTSVIRPSDNTSSKTIETMTRQTWSPSKPLVTAPKPTQSQMQRIREVPATIQRTVTRTIDVPNPDYEVFMGQLRNDQAMTPTGKVITAEQQAAFGGTTVPKKPAVVTAAPPRTIKKVITEVITEPNPRKKKVVSSSSGYGTPAPSAKTFTTSATKQTITEGQRVRLSNGDIGIVQSDGSFLNTRTGRTSVGSSRSTSSRSSNPPINQVGGSSTSSSGVGGTTRSMESSDRWTTGY